MTTFSQGKYALAISDRSGMAFPYNEMVREWNGALVHVSEYEPKQPQLDPKPTSADPQALQRARTARTEFPTEDFLPENPLVTASNTTLKINFPNGNLQVNVKQIQFDREKKQDYYKFSISLSLEFVEKKSSTKIKTYNVSTKEYGEIVGSFAIKDQDNLDINLMHKSLESISSKLLELN